MLLFTGGTTTFILLWQYIYISIAVFVVSIMFVHDCAVILYIHVHCIKLIEQLIDSGVLLHHTANVQYTYVHVYDCVSYMWYTSNCLKLKQVFYHLKFSVRFVPFYYA